MISFSFLRFSKKPLASSCKSPFLALFQAIPSPVLLPPVKPPLYFHAFFWFTSINLSNSKSALILSRIRFTMMFITLPLL